MKTYHRDVIGNFTSGLIETLRRSTDWTSWEGIYETWLQHSCEISWRRTTERSWQRTTKTPLGVSIETILRCCGDLPMECRCYVLLRRCRKVPSWSCGDALLRDLGRIPPSYRLVFFLRRPCDILPTNRKTSPLQGHGVLLSGGIIIFIILSIE